MQLRYHPVTAFVLVYLTGVIVFSLVLGALAVFAHPVWVQIHSSGFLIFLPFMLSFFAAQQSFKGNGPPFVQFLHDDLDALRARFEDGHLRWTVVFALLATVITILVALVLWMLGASGNPFGNLFMIAVALGINGVSCFKGIGYALTPPKAFEPDTDFAADNPATWAAWAVRRMQKNMRTGGASSVRKP